VLSLSALALALGAAVLHAVWNLLIARTPDTEAATAVAFATGALCCVPVAVITWDVDDTAIPYLAASAALELAYMALLARGYARGRALVVYPVARGSAPVLVLVGAVLFASAHATALQVLGVTCVAIGVALLRGLGSGAGGEELAWGLAIGATIAGYTLVDDRGLHHAAALPYLAIVIGVPSLTYAAWLRVRRGAAPLRAACSRDAVLAGVCAFAAYGLFLLALERAAAAPVAAVRETSVLIAALLAAVLLHERPTRLGLAGAAVVTAGIVILALA
jgi:drug/metabolite transporter (DMT)-like permease